MKQGRHFKLWLSIGLKPQSYQRGENNTYYYIKNIDTQINPEVK
jgi:hypothetical protein